MMAELFFDGKYIGEIKEIFEIYSYVTRNETKDRIRQRLREIYAKMKRKNPKLIDINWNL